MKVENGSDDSISLKQKTFLCYVQLQKLSEIFTNRCYVSNALKGIRYN